LEKTLVVLIVSAVNILVLVGATIMYYARRRRMAASILGA